VGFDDVRYALQEKVRENPRQIVMGVLAGVLLVAAAVLIGRAFVGPAPEEPDVPGLRTKREARGEDAAVEQARREREREAERLRREAEAQGEDLDRNPRGAIVGDG